MLTLLLGRSAMSNAQQPMQFATDPFEPTVTRQESTLLAEAMALATNQPNQAIALLSDKNRPATSPAIDFAIGNLHFQQNQLDEAAAAYEAALVKMPNFRSAIINLGRIFLMQQRTTEAITLYQRLVANGQADAPSLLLLGHALLLEDAPVSAETAYRQVLLLAPDNQEARIGLAKTLILQERYPEALALIGEILQANPINPELWILRSNAYLAMGQQERAARTIEQARRLGVASAEQLAALGDLLINRNQPTDALDAYQAAFKLQAPTPERMLRSIEAFLMIQDETGAQTMIQDAKARASATWSPAQQTQLLRLQAEWAQQRNQIEEAKELCRQIIAQDPLDGRTLLLLANLQQQDGQREKALINAERAARITGFEAEALRLQAQIEVQRERYRDAIPLLEAAQAFEPQPHVARYLDQIRRLAQ